MKLEGNWNASSGNEPTGEALLLVARLACQERHQFDDSINEEAKPKVDKCAPIDQTVVPGGRREKRSRFKIENVAHNHRGQIFYPVVESNDHFDAAEQSDFAILMW